MDTRDQLICIYRALDRFFGPLHWWPGDTPFEVAVGAILTQNTNWANVEKAIGRIKAIGAMSPFSLYGLDPADLEELIRPSGYYRVKARRLRAFLEVLCGSFGGDLDAMLSGDLAEARRRLLAISGIGEETADSILLYAGGRPVFVVDAYTRRILERHGILKGRHSYGEIQRLFMQELPPDAGLYNQYHALIVEAGKRFCRREPLCGRCPLNGISERFGRAGNIGREKAGRRSCSPGKTFSNQGSRKNGACSC
ncbi:MAG: endonuclease III domain-containing protein [Syntrophaceae bacterium]|nr:endonuclease III domain-containing protein [Syntrophaceae bacterium]